MKILLTCTLGLSIYLISLGAIAIPLNQNFLEKKSTFFSNLFDQYSNKPTLVLRRGAGKNNVVQGLTIDSKRETFYTLHVTGNPEKGVLNRFKINNKAKQWIASDTQNPSNLIGHQGITLDPLSGTLYSSSGTGVVNNGWYITKFNYSPKSLPKNIKIIKVFDETYNTNLNTMPSISPDGKIMVVRGKKGKSNIIRIYSFPKIRNQTDITSKFNNEWQVDPDFTQGGQPFQAMTTDGRYVYMLSGKGNLFSKRLYVYDLSGKIIQKIDNLNLGMREARTIGNSNLWEPEGLAIDGVRKELNILFAVGDKGHRKAHLHRVRIQD
ncbi:hypothetical protein BS636_07235 [Acinetobacter sp. LoGeW2-3]|uniref:phage baseplate protein n=1 Tax=Acinetobacter sp. LoGeW2-3 TaxID=1808001 RepID=UPI000C05A3B8|nr:hypothetical protein [Acinetobacter sp. LoGeW2-3]ATO19466.1 hypothetical protein BS636_07235 [Acinetobacter sp. LoGeW2-3]